MYVRGIAMFGQAPSVLPMFSEMFFVLWSRGKCMRGLLRGRDTSELSPVIGMLLQETLGCSEQTFMLPPL
jgi:hypothetical protein